MDDERLKNLGGDNYWKELLDRIRDIRSSEKVMYRQVFNLYATSADYALKSSESIVVSGRFDFAEIQAMRHAYMQYISDYVKYLDNVLKTTGEKVLQSPGTINHKQAIEKATEEYKGISGTELGAGRKGIFVKH